MPSIRNRNGKWQAQVRVQGHKPQSRSFTSKRDAQRWARSLETELEATAFSVDRRVLDRECMADLLQRYRRDVTVNKRGAASECKRIDGFMREGWAKLPISRATPQVFSKYRDQRLRSVSPGTVIRDLGLLRSIFEVARHEWDYPIKDNPVAMVRKPRAPEARERRLNPGELEAVLQAADRCRNDWMRAGILLAVETGMRRGELLALRWADICLDTGTALIPVTKTGHARRVPLTEEACAILRERREAPANRGRDRVFHVTANAFRQCWERCRRWAAEDVPSLSDLRFHDLRHEAVSRFFEMGLSVPEVALISGHRDPRMLFRYTHLRAEDLAQKIRGVG
jgi:integrase